MTPASAVSSPVFVTSTVRDPPPTTDPATTASPLCLPIGSDSPVRSDSSTSLSPSTTVPSAGIADPGRTITRSPTASSEAATVRVSSPPSPTTSSASSGMSAASSPRAFCAPMTADISSQWPSSMIVMRVASSHQKSMPSRPRVTAAL